MSTVGSLVEGGQTWAHRVRMVRQALKVAFYLSLTISSFESGYFRIRPHSWIWVEEAELSEKESSTTGTTTGEN